MELKEYQELAKNTLAHLSMDELDHSHMALGIAGELLEVQELFYKEEDKIDQADLILELGDICWYVACYCTLLDTDLDYLQHNGSLITASKEVIEFTKKNIAYERDINMRDSLHKLIYSLRKFAGIYGINFSDVLECNIEKLMHRYPQGFNKEVAQTLDI